jgi:cytochrome c oxidase cbb3-type subunit 3
MTERDQLSGHDYDGIQEYDNDLPTWWLGILWGTVAFAGIYLLVYVLAGAAVGPEAWSRSVAELGEQRARSATGPLPEDLLRQLSRNGERIAKGRALFASSQCATCHGAEGTGLIGPNLRDDWWLHGSDMTDLVTTLTEGRNNGAMPAQRANLSPDDIVSLAAFVADANRNAKAAGKPHDPAREREQPIGY